MPFDQAITARGAVAGALAAGIWAAQQPLDKRLFGVDYDDTELLGKTVTKGAAWPFVGLAMHLVNGAVFGAVYANVAPRIPLPSWARGPAAGLTEHATTWPSMVAVDRFHPARKDLPATWRHLVFGVALGEIERRLNAPSDPEVPSYEHVASTNGHGNLEAALSGQQS
jgi:hypothetical protein